MDFKRTSVSCNHMEAFLYCYQLLYIIYLVKIRNDTNPTQKLFNKLL